jgi:hypothetical protein
MCQCADSAPFIDPSGVLTGHGFRRAEDKEQRHGRL